MCLSDMYLFHGAFRRCIYICAYIHVCVYIYICTCLIYIYIYIYIINVIYICIYIHLYLPIRLHSHNNIYLRTMPCLLQGSRESFVSRRLSRRHVGLQRILQHHQRGKFVRMYTHVCTMRPCACVHDSGGICGYGCACTCTCDVTRVISTKIVSMQSTCFRLLLAHACKI